MRFLSRATERLNEDRQENFSLKFLKYLSSVVGTSSLVSDGLYYVNPCCLCRAHSR